MTDAPKKKGGGCLTGCLITALVIVVLLVGGVALGKSWIVSKVQEQIPALAVIKNVHGDLQGDRSGSTDPADFPQTVYVPADFTQAAFRTTPDDALAMLQYESADADTILGDIRTHMRKRGWKVDRTEVVSRGERLYLKKGNERCDFAVYATGKGVEVWIQVRA